MWISVLNSRLCLHLSRHSPNGSPNLSITSSSSGSGWKSTFHFDPSFYSLQWTALYLASLASSSEIWNHSIKSVSIDYWFKPFSVCTMSTGSFGSINHLDSSSLLNGLFRNTLLHLPYFYSSFFKTLLWISWTISWGFHIITNWFFRSFLIRSTVFLLF